MYEPNAQLQGLIIEVSPNATDGSWQRIGNGTSAAPFATGWTEINLSAALLTTLQRFVRVQLPTSMGSCALAQAEFHGRYEPAGGMDNCTVSVSVTSRTGIAAAHLHSAYAYSADNTPVVASVSPAYGTAAGGTTVTISGMNLPTSVDDAIVMVDGVECVVSSAAGDSVVCVTGERGTIPRQSSFVVASHTHGYGIVSRNAFMYKDRWSSRVTWAGVRFWFFAESIALTP